MFQKGEKTANKYGKNVDNVNLFNSLFAESGFLERGVNDEQEKIEETKNKRTKKRKFYFFKKNINILMSSKLYIFLIIILIIAFYWFAYRPNQIKKECGEKATEFIKENGGSAKDFNTFYDVCIKREGL